jgi:hypothetical protein
MSSFRPMPESITSPLTVSTLSYPLPARRYWLLFQSWTQLQSYLVIVLASTLAIHGLALVSGARVMPIGALLAGLAVGGLISVLMVMKARFTVAPASEAAVRRVVTEVECARYVEVGAQGNAIVYRQNLPRLLRWDEGNIQVARDGDTLVLTGPVAKLRSIRARLAAT